MSFGLYFILAIGVMMMLASAITADNYYSNVFGMLGASLFTSAIWFAFAQYDAERTPKAIDVYRGNTTLEITYKDSIPLDTVVVFKDIK